MVKYLVSQDAKLDNHPRWRLLGTGRTRLQARALPTSLVQVLHFIEKRALLARGAAGATAAVP